jgi:hypothetical protein
MPACSRVAVGAPEIFDDRVDRATGLTLEVEELDKTRPLTFRRRQAVAVRAHHEIGRDGGVRRGRRGFAVDEYRDTEDDDDGREGRPCDLGRSAHSCPAHPYTVGVTEPKTDIRLLDR